MTLTVSVVSSISVTFSGVGVVVVVVLVVEFSLTMEVPLEASVFSVSVEEGDEDDGVEGVEELELFGDPESVLLVACCVVTITPSVVLVALSLT